MSLINKAQVKRKALEVATAERSHKFTRVSQQFIDDIEATVRNAIVTKVKATPSKGKTL